MSVWGSDSWRSRRWWPFVTSFRSIIAYLSILLSTGIWNILMTSTERTCPKLGSRRNRWESPIWTILLHRRRPVKTKADRSSESEYWIMHTARKCCELSTLRLSRKWEYTRLTLMVGGLSLTSSSQNISFNGTSAMLCCLRSTGSSQKVSCSHVSSISFHSSSIHWRYHRRSQSQTRGLPAIEATKMGVRLTQERNWVS